MKLKITLIFLFLATVLGSCQKDTVNDGKLTYFFKTTNLNVSVGSTSAGSGQPVPALSNGSLTWTSGTVNIAKVEFSGKRGQSAAKIDYSNITNIDVLSTGTASGSIILPAGVYTDIELKIKLAQSTTTPPLTLKGTYTEVSGTKIPVEVRFNEDFDLKSNISQITIKGDKYTANVTLDLAKMMNGLAASDLGQTARTQPNNTILVTNTINTVLYGKLKANLLLVPNVQITHN